MHEHLHFEAMPDVLQKICTKKGLGQYIKMEKYAAVQGRGRRLGLQCHCSPSLFPTKAQKQEKIKKLLKAINMMECSLKGYDDYTLEREMSLPFINAPLAVFSNK